MDIHQKRAVVFGTGTGLMSGTFVLVPILKRRDARRLAASAKFDEENKAMWLVVGIVTERAHHIEYPDVDTALNDYEFERIRLMDEGKLRD